LNLVFASGFLFPQRLLRHDYFRGVRAVFPGACFPRVPLTGSIDARARALADEIARFRFPDPDGPIHVVGHSMGGLDARYLLDRNLSGLGGRIASLSTIGTPHRGSPIADFLVGPEPDRRSVRRRLYGSLRRAMSVLGLRSGAMDNLTSGFARRFNEAHPGTGGVPCYCYAGVGAEAYLLRVTSGYIRDVGRSPEERDNDGLVTVASAAWKPLAEPPWPTDHLGEVGHSLVPPRFASCFPHLEALRRVVRRAAGEPG
jgi:triacylglycerol lipase